MEVNPIIAGLIENLEEHSFLKTAFNNIDDIPELQAYNWYVGATEELITVEANVLYEKYALDVMSDNCINDVRIPSASMRKLNEQVKKKLFG